MAGTQAGGVKAAAVNRQRYGLDFYKQIGRKGGKISRGGGFAQNKELAAEAGRKGGSTSRRGPSKITERPTPGELEIMVPADHPKRESFLAKIRSKISTRA